jgi:hypothetical protein
MVSFAFNIHASDGTRALPHCTRFHSFARKCSFYYCTRSTLHSFYTALNCKSLEGQTATGGKLKRRQTKGAGNLRVGHPFLYRMYLLDTGAIPWNRSAALSGPASLAARRAAAPRRGGGGVPAASRRFRRHGGDSNEGHGAARRTLRDAHRDEDVVEEGGEGSPFKLLRRLEGGDAVARAVDRPQDAAQARVAERAAHASIFAEARERAQREERRRAVVAAEIVVRVAEPRRRRGGRRRRRHERGERRAALAVRRIARNGALAHGAVAAGAALFRGADAADVAEARGGAAGNGHPSAGGAEEAQSTQSDE